MTTVTNPAAPAPAAKYPTVVCGPYVREIPRSARADMRVPARIYADDALWRVIEGDRSLDQLVNVATLPGVTGCV